MNKYLILGVFFIFSNNLVIKSEFNADSVFHAANEAYIKEDYNAAIQQYEEILSQGFESPELYYNLGNAYYKLTDYPKSILNYERALLHDPRDENIRFNLAKAQIYNVDQIDQIPEFVIKKWLRTAISWFRSDTWAILSLVSFLLCTAGFLVYFLTTKIKLRRSGFYTGMLFLILSVLTFFIASQSRKILVNSNGAIVMTSTVTVKGSPSNSSTDLFIIHEGTKVYILEELNDWFEVKLSDGKQGWLLKSDIEPI
jgi:hypothetical protein